MLSHTHVAKYTTFNPNKIKCFIILTHFYSGEQVNSSKQTEIQKIISSNSDNLSLTKFILYCLGQPHKLPIAEKKTSLQIYIFKQIIATYHVFTIYYIHPR